MDKPQKIIKLTDSAEAALTEDSDMPGMYTINKTGSGDADFYISHGDENVELITVQFFVDQAVTLASYLQLYVNGGWVSVVPYEDSFAADGSSQKINAAYPLRDIIPSGTKARMKLTVGGACDVFCRVVAI